MDKSNPDYEHFVNVLAETCHEANRAFCHSLGDDSIAPWPIAAENIRSSSRDGVRFILDNPDAPFSASHENWLNFKVADGWVYGEVKSEAQKTHPALVPYDELPQFQKTKDAIFAGIVRGMKAGYDNHNN